MFFVLRLGREKVRRFGGGASIGAFVLRLKIEEGFFLLGVYFDEGETM